jgi:hypothetical protein
MSTLWFKSFEKEKNRDFKTYLGEMNVATLFFSFGVETPKYYSLLLEEDFEFKTKNIKVDVEKTNEETLVIQIKTSSLIDSKIGISAVLKSLEIIEKTVLLGKNE